jgi:hypothetical protein
MASAHAPVAVAAGRTTTHGDGCCTHAHKSETLAAHTRKNKAPHLAAAHGAIARDAWAEHRVRGHSCKQDAHMTRRRHAACVCVCVCVCDCAVRRDGRETTRKPKKHFRGLHSDGCTAAVERARCADADAVGMHARSPAGGQQWRTGQTLVTRRLTPPSQHRKRALDGAAQSRLDRRVNHRLPW